MQNLRRIVAGLILAALLPLLCAGEGVKVCTWNLHDFPSGVYNLKKPEVEATNILRTAAVIRAIKPDVLLLQEVRDEDACRKLAEALKPATYHVLVCSAFKDESGIPTFQQVAILASKPAVTGRWERWTTGGLVDPPRGFAYAVIEFGKTKAAFYCVHLKSNRQGGGDPSRETQLNILKRELAAEQILRHAKLLQDATNGVSAAIVGGDFNTDRTDPAYVSENTLPSFESAGYGSCFDGQSHEACITIPGKGRYRDAVFDYILFRGAKGRGAPVPAVFRSDVSDHYAVACDLVFQ